MKRVKLYISLILASAFLAACGGGGNITKNDDKDIAIYPDYKNVTIPCNIAPMNFCVKDSTDTEYALQISAGERTMWVDADDKDFVIDSDDWKALTQLKPGSTTPKSITFTIARKENDEWVGSKPFKMTVVADSIDDYLTYRLVPPGYVSWYKMGIYQHQLSTSEESVVMENSHLKGACMNCHTVGSHRSDRTLFHIRSYYGGTYLFRNGKIERLEAKTDSTISGFVYPSWHPDGRYIAFSNNKTAQEFHTSDRNRIEVFDDGSDVIMYDADKHEVFSTPLLKSEDYWETFPSFSPDGKWLYFCKAKRVREVSLNYKDVHYSLCRIAFDAEKAEFGTEVETLYDAEETGRSISFPRVSPDGKWIIATIHDFGNFSIWHRNAELYIAPIPEAGFAASASSILDWKKLFGNDWGRGGCSYHSWSSNGRWLVFSSRRDDGLYTRPYFTYMDKSGKPHKPFMLPQEKPRKFYKQRDLSYNVPEFMTSRFETPMRDIIEATTQDSIPVTYRK
ncbi:MAG: hypothetical protein MJZ32_01640 [Bacteroidaceae bacterium]|nr:hypothetical protein [Bacteroidaceae bacterium]